MKYTLYSLLAATLMVSACKKEKQEEIQPFRIHNNGTGAVTVDFYNTWEDYGKSINIAFSRRVEPGQTIEIPSEVTGLNKSNFGTRQYYYDAYSDDHTNSSWPPIEFNYNHAIIKPDIFETMLVGKMSHGPSFKKMFLDNTVGHTTWKVVDAVDYQSHVSVWSQLSEDQKHLRFTFNKAQEATIEKRVSGSLVTTHHYFDIWEDVGSEFSVAFSEDDDVTSMPGYKTLFHHNASEDTMEAYGPNNSMYLLVKEH